ncbi:hypothetical protein AB4876_16185 [Zhongshania guokunii]|uniref:MotA/TolQ/ExbB proton channel family protein n=1 Tax=Zhongshania guokunii TaxID=641783 RepID=A0ABV3U975_9GAMM
MTTLDFLLLIFATPALIALVALIIMLYRGKSSMIFRFTKFGKLLILEKIFFILAGCGLILCFYAGAEVSLRWVPESFGIKTDVGDFVPLSALFAGAFSVFGGIALLSVSIEAVRTSILQKIKLEEFKLINDAHRFQSNILNTQMFRDELKTAIAKLESDNPQIKILRDGIVRSFEEEKRDSLNRVLSLIDN